MGKKKHFFYIYYVCVGKNHKFVRQNYILQLINHPMQPSDFIHPEDAAALRQMESIPGFAAMVKNLGYWHREPAVWGEHGFFHTAIRETAS